MAYPVNPTGVFPGFAETIKGWLNSGWLSKYNEITARYVDMEDRQEAQINFHITQYYRTRSINSLGSISLPTDQAIQLAKQIVPKYIADAIDAAVKNNAELIK
jgi:hypothetical protein